MPKPTMNPDGTVTFPTKGRDTLTLEEPSMAEMAEFTEAALAADAELTEMPLVTDLEDVEQVKAYQDALSSRTGAIFGSAHPYGGLVLKIVNALTPEDTVITEDQLYAWAASPRTVRTMLEHWRAPLPGAESAL